MTQRKPDVEAVAIGASAGGIEALLLLLPALPAMLAAPVFVVLHLPPGRRSLLTEIFAPRCRLPVREAEDKQPVEPGCIYFAPPDYHLLVDRETHPSPGAGPRLALSCDAPVNWSRPAIDVLFESAAEAYGAGLLAMVLTGASQDGAAGLAAVAVAGGTALVQQPASALVPTMPEQALLACPSALALNLDDLAARLAALATRTPSSSS